MNARKPTVVSLVGARPQFIKTAPLVKIISKKVNHILVHAGQHYDTMMSGIFFNELTIPKPKYNLEVGSGSHAEMTGAIMTRFEKLLVKMKPDMVLVYGDTNTTLAGALAAVKTGIPIGHIEAGLRSFRTDMPEEINRVLTDRISALLYCPTRAAIANLKREGIKQGLIKSGDLMYELIDLYLDKIKINKRILDRCKISAGEYLVMTMHRAANVDNKSNLLKLAGILENLNQPVVFPVHPRTEKNLKHFKLWHRLKKIPVLHIFEPVSYLDNLSLIYNARAVLTDSGGIQKEAVFLGTSCLTLRDETEWIETLKKGNLLVGLSKSKILSALKNLPPKRQMTYKIGGKKPSEIITDSILAFFGN